MIWTIATALHSVDRDRFFDLRGRTNGELDALRGAVYEVVYGDICAWRLELVREGGAALIAPLLVGPVYKEED